MPTTDHDSTPDTGPQAPDIGAIERLLAASVAYAAAVRVQLEIAARPGVWAGSPEMTVARQGADALGLDVLTAAQDIRSPARLTGYEAALVDAGRKYRNVDAPYYEWAGSERALLSVATQPEETRR